MNLYFVLLGVEFGRELANVTALIQLTYSGRTEAGHIFVLTVLTATYEKTRTDTLVSSRTLLVHSDAEDAIRYGRVVTAQNHGDYRVTSARIADVAPTVHDWIWKSLAAPGAAPATVPELERAMRRVQDSQRAIDAAIDAFHQLAQRAVRDN